MQENHGVTITVISEILIVGHVPRFLAIAVVLHLGCDFGLMRYKISTMELLC